MGFVGPLVLPFGVPRLWPFVARQVLASLLHRRQQADGETVKPPPPKQDVESSHHSMGFQWSITIGKP
jgi:hypothetical protein